MLVVFDAFLLYIWMGTKNEGLRYSENIRSGGNAIAIGVTAFGFALIHQPQLGYAGAPLLLIIIVGVVLTYVRARTGSVGSSFLLHVAYNTTLFTLLWLQTDHFHHMERAAAAVFTLKP
jgi:hypothetical protein